VPVVLTSHGRVSPWTRQYTYDPPPAPPSCSSREVCPMETVQCPSPVDFYLSDPYSTTSLASGTTTFSHSVYANSGLSLVACPAGLDLTWGAQSCVGFSLYDPLANSCGNQNNHCPKGTHWCGDDEGCQRVCT
jgi:hypothetical protein